LAKTTADTVTLAAANTYSGLTTIWAGTLRLGANNAIPGDSEVTVLGRGTLDIGAYTSFPGVVTLIDGTITGTTGSLYSEFDVRKGTISAKLDGWGLTKTTADTVTLAAANTYFGDTTISAGTLRLGAANAIPSGSDVTVQGGGTLDTGAYGTSAGTVTLVDGTITGAWLYGKDYQVRKGTISAELAGSGGLTKTTADTVTLAAFNLYTGATTISAGTLLLGAEKAIPSASDVTVQGGSTLDLGAYGTGAETVTLVDGTITGGWLYGTDYQVRKGTISANLGGIGGLTKTTADTVTLAGANTFIGTTTISAGTLKLVAGAAMARTIFDVNAGATLDLSDLVGGLTLGAGQSIKGGGRVLGDLVVGGTLSPGESPGILSVQGITFAAGSTLNMELGGTVRGGGYDALVSSGGVVLQNGSTLSVSLISNFVPEMGDEFDVLDFSSLSGRFTTINLPALAGGLSWSTDELYLNGTIGVAPEPATLALLALGSLGMLVRRRREYSALKPQLG